MLPVAATAATHLKDLSTWLGGKIEPFLYQIDGALFRFLKESPNILAQNPQAKNMRRTQKKNRQHQRSPPSGLPGIEAENCPIERILQEHNQGKTDRTHTHDKSQQHDELQWAVTEVDDAVEPQPE
jgi:hypothetical protein